MNATLETEAPLSTRTEGQKATYDGRAAAYDAIVGSAAYNRLLWNTSVADYRAFAARAVAATDAGPLLDAGCGSLVFTAPAYANTSRPLVLLDRSARMLARAAQRLNTAGYSAPNAALVQGDLLNLPFAPGAFPTVLCMGMLHLFSDDDAARVMTGLCDVLAPGGTLFLSCLVAETGWGARYLSLLHRAGEVAPPRTCGEAARVIRSVAGPRGMRVVAECRGCMAYFTVTRLANRSSAN